MKAAIELSFISSVRYLFLGVMLLLICAHSYSQSSAQNGFWTVGSTWSGGTAPPVSGGWEDIDVLHDIVLNGNYSLRGRLDVQSSGILTIGNNATVKGGSNLHVYGTLNINGDATLTGNLIIHPGGRVIIDGTVTVFSAEYLTVGDADEAPPYADLVIKEDLYSQGSGDVTVNRNGRVAIYGSVIGNGGGIILRINDGGQVYVYEDVSFTGGGNQIINNNSTDPYGFYVNGDVTNSGGGSHPPSNVGDQEDMEDTNSPFHEWVSLQSESPLPVTLVFFNIQRHETGVVLQWQTATEINNDYFTVERSADGKHFSEVARIKGHGNSKKKINYEWTRAVPLTGLTYYRLKQTDFDGQFEYLGVISVSPEGLENRLSVYPNPVSPGQGIAVRGVLLENSPWTLFSLNGNVSKAGVFTPGQQIDTSGLSKGLYVLRIELPGSRTLSRKVVVR